MKIIRTTNLIPVNKEKTSILLVKKSGGEGYRQKWTFPGQIIKKEEDIDKITSSLSFTELGISTNKLIKFDSTEIKTKNSVIKSQYHIAEIDMKIKLNKGKYSKAEWFKLNEELYFLDYPHTEKDIITDLFEKINKLK
jgi:ADP-ribose pyrophosphatase YjhB (NUDIX family)